MSSSIVIIVLLLGYSLYRRVSRTVRFIPLQSRRLLTRTVIWLLLLVLIPVLQASVVPTAVFLWYAVGLVLGVVLGGIAMRTVRYEERGGVMHYRMNLWIGAIVTLLFLARLLTDFSTDGSLLQSGAQSPTAPAPSLLSDGSSLGLFALVFAYYAFTGIMLYLRARSFAQSAPK
ncbi:MAG: hypothetical protein OWT28_04435 [Firmicutes bacterium]|nr:hypothetical protein [Bacillota bacterium]